MSNTTKTHDNNFAMNPRKIYLTGALVKRKNTEHVYDYVPETIPCCWASCKGKLYNSTLCQKLMCSYDDDEDIFEKYPDIYKIMCDKENIEDPYLDDENYKEFINMGEYNDESLGMCCYPKEFDQISCDTCGEFYVVCSKCEMPCIMQEHSGYFYSGTKSDSIWLGRQINDGGQECIIIWDDKSKIINNLNLNHNIIIRNAKDDMDEHEYYVGDKGISWTCDPRINLYLNGNKYEPMFTGPDGGFGITYYCKNCDVTGYFNDK